MPVDALRAFDASNSREWSSATSVNATARQGCSAVSGDVVCVAKGSCDTGWLGLTTVASYDDTTETAAPVRLAHGVASSSLLDANSTDAPSSSRLTAPLTPHAKLAPSAVAPYPSLRVVGTTNTYANPQITQSLAIDSSSVATPHTLYRGECVSTGVDSALRHRITPTLPKLLDDVDMSFYAGVRGCEFGTTRQPAPASLEPSWGGGLAKRMHVTAGLMLPSDTPIHVVCGSKDVVHSWAIPGLLIKIDCIPGYNAHRRLLVRWRGLF